MINGDYSLNLMKMTMLFFLFYIVSFQTEAEGVQQIIV